MTSGRTTLTEGARVLTDNGTAVVVDVSAAGVLLRDCVGDVAHVGWAELSSVRSVTEGRVDALTEALQPT